ncbi:MULTISPECIES: manganese-dependent inorganic pyrophosphatase [Aerococcus]|uniref:manganese-dependent inorganic pyrophosphatase n=1 Tax=Aerococcus TaxID=1375 RepID=UPI00227C8081|nr:MULTISPECIES: manganese-dependent inorganic pyrophosphatase [Aerococcus]MCY3035870.1 manganese-dependent inorganic pyrophosphatase [Aerococcus sp. Group 2]MCY3038965.1 manganese-dependent inorganic pyrophosphatase [Aerococcus sp. Group 2]MCY3040537.1 manganese-dependent inorganic pyrophosphatase [Aerococcus sp. Group 2]MCY3042534.1 manganese-dependent inorganic pyrophosphatase [Aerococcus sp. Group 2]MDK6519982.1 manganese-dependent inorganic pyrophosphatase [Aerococcus urinae]
MSKILIFGHQNPDMDAITSAISLSYLLNTLGYETEPVALGEANDETQYALDHFNHEGLRVIEKAGDETDTVALVDHNEFQQSVADIKDLNVFAVVDHHRVGNFETSAPLYYIAKPLGCTQSVIYDLYQEKGVEIPQQIAGLMLSGIISDTLLYSSPTCTEKDKEIAKKLAEIAGVDDESYGTEMLKAGANVDDKSAEEIADGDAKSFSMGGKEVRIGQVNVVDANDVIKRKDEVLKAMKELLINNNYDAFLLVITNILTNDSEGLLVGDDSLTKNFEKAFDVDVTDHQLALKGIVSRKKQIVPPLTDSFEG